MEQSEFPDVRVNILRLRPGDHLIAYTEHPLSEQQALDLRDDLRQVTGMPDLQVAFADPGLRLEVLRVEKDGE
jgi:hypothetical protein